jgi:hypothetical protein
MAHYGALIYSGNYWRQRTSQHFEQLGVRVLSRRQAQRVDFCKLERRQLALVDVVHERAHHLQYCCRLASAWNASDVEACTRHVACLVCLLNAVHYKATDRLRTGEQLRQLARQLNSWSSSMSPFRAERVGSQPARAGGHGAFSPGECNLLDRH